MHHYQISNKHLVLSPISTLALTQQQFYLPPNLNAPVAPPATAGFRSETLEGVIQTPSSHFASPAILNFLGPAISPILDGGPTPIPANVQQPPPVPLSVAHTPMSVQSSVAPSVSASAASVHAIAGVGTETTHSNSPSPSDTLDEEFPALPSTSTTSFIHGSALSSTATSEVTHSPSGSVPAAPPASLKPPLPPLPPLPALVPKKPPQPPQLCVKKEKERPKPALPAIATNLKGKAKATPVASMSTTPIKEVEAEGKEEKAKEKEKDEARKEKEKAKETKRSSSKVTSTKSEAAATFKAGAKAALKATPIPTPASGPATKQKDISPPAPPPVEEHAPIMARQTKKVKASQIPKPRKQQPHTQNLRDDTTRESTPELSNFIQETIQPVVPPYPPIKAGVDELLAQMYDLPELKWMSFFGGGPGLHPRSKLELSSLVEALSALSGTAHAWGMSNGHYKDGGSTSNSHSTTPIDNAVISFQQLLETLTHTISDLLHLLPRTTWNEGVNFDGIIQDMLKSDLLDEFGPRDEDEEEEAEEEAEAEEQGEGDEVSNAENFAEGIDRRAQWMQLQCESSIPGRCDGLLIVWRPASEQARRIAPRHKCGLYSSRACL